tara:strand:+ start:2025 stop:2474 length:450 start_codon:yes stop_codon:yes gene_type:complete
MGQGFGTAGEKDTPYFGVEVMPHRYISGATPYDVDAKFTRTVKLWMNSESNVERSSEYLKEMGWDGKFKDLEPGGSCDLTGKTVTLVNKHQEGHDGKVWDSFEFPFRGEVLATIANDNSIAAKLDRLYKVNAAKKKATAATTTDEETPF